MRRASVGAPRIEQHGWVTVLAERCDGRRFYSPDDVVVRADGSTWFADPVWCTDPVRLADLIYGISGDYEGSQSESEIGDAEPDPTRPDPTPRR